jgi:RNA polymerase sigma-70 factor (ECF subfamily)
MKDADRDHALLDRLARTGDPRAFDVLYRRHTGVLYSTAWRLTRDADVAGDLVHDTWVRAVEAAHAVERRSSFRTWITGILINRHREYERARRRESVTPDEDDCIGETIDPRSAAPLDASGIDRIDLEAAVAALPPGFRQVLVLHDIEGFTHEEIAEAGWRRGHRRASSPALANGYGRCSRPEYHERSHEAHDPRHAR